jgi:two-component sensor histidine kinase
LISRTAYFFFFIFGLATLPVAQTNFKPVAGFSFNDAKDYDEVSKAKAKLVGVKFTEDRFNNENSAVYLFGNGNSYINLGNYPALKQRKGSISLWVKIERPAYAGKGDEVNPVLITKSTDQNDFNESYSIYYVPESERIVACYTRDSLRQIGIYGMKTFKKLAWHHLVITYDDFFASFYIDGKEAGKNPKNYVTQFNPLDSVLVGVTGNEKNDRYLIGIVDDITFYDRVLTESEIKELYNAPNPNKYRLLLNKALNVLGIVAGLVLIYFLFRYMRLRKEKEQLQLTNKILETELRVNRALMNPHFVFNSMNTLQDLILKREIREANNYLVKFSKLMRKILESNTSNHISLDMEIDLIKKYLEIEAMRFGKEIHHSVELTDDLVPSTVYIPVMMVQPFIENAIWHGLLEKQGEKILRISFSPVENRYVLCTVEDNGVGRKKMEQESSEKKSLATGFVLQRIHLLNKIYRLNCTLSIDDKPLQEGTVVKILLPVLTNRK